jgi:hypothetical protein
MNAPDPRAGKTEINGVAVIERTPAKIQIGANLSTVNTVDEVLLADGTVVFQCVTANAPECDHIASTPRGITAHQRAHSPVLELRRLKTEQAKRKENYRTGALKGIETKRAKKAQSTLTPTPTSETTPEATPETTDIPTGSDASTGITPKRTYVKARADRATTTATTAHASLALALSNLREAVNDAFISVKIVEQAVADVIGTTALTDDIIEKAKKFDELQRLMGK